MADVGANGVVNVVVSVVVSAGQISSQRFARANATCHRVARGLNRRAMLGQSRPYHSRRAPTSFGRDIAASNKTGVTLTLNQYGGKGH